LLQIETQDGTNLAPPLTLIGAHTPFLGEEAHPASGLPLQLGPNMAANSPRHQDLGILVPKVAYGPLQARGIEVKPFNIGSAVVTEAGVKLEDEKVGWGIHVKLVGGGARQ
jgi:hypothetical protein